MTRVLFVCTGNTCRSPMAEAILKNQEIPGVEVKSAGIYAVDGSEASENTKKVLAENNLVHHHRSAQLNESLVEWTSVILTMTLNHKNAISSMFPHVAEKTFTLKEYVNAQGNVDIMDPYGGPLDVYRSTYHELSEAISNLIHAITENEGEHNGGKA